MRAQLIPEQVQEVFEKAEHQAEYIIGMYVLAYGAERWERITSVNGWPKVNERTALDLMDRAIHKDIKLHPDVVPGGGWMNRGFSCDTQDSLGLADYEVELAEVEEAEQ